MLVCLFLTAAFLTAGHRLLTNLKNNFPVIYAAIRNRVIVLTMAGSLAMLLRAVLSALLIFSPDIYRNFKENSLIADNLKFPGFLAIYLLLCEILPLFSFQLFLLISMNSARSTIITMSSIVADTAEFERLRQDGSRRSSMMSSFNSDRRFSIQKYSTTSPGALIGPV